MCILQQQRTEDLLLFLPLAPFIEGSCLTGLWMFCREEIKSGLLYCQSQVIYSTSFNVPVLHSPNTTVCACVHYSTCAAGLVRCFPLWLEVSVKSTSPLFLSPLVMPRELVHTCVCLCVVLVFAYVRRYPFNVPVYTVYVRLVCSILLILHASGGCTLSHSYKTMLNC